MRPQLGRHESRPEKLRSRDQRLLNSGPLHKDGEGVRAGTLEIIHGDGMMPLCQHDSSAFLRKPVQAVVVDDKRYVAPRNPAVEEIMVNLLPNRALKPLSSRRSRR